METLELRPEQWEMGQAFDDYLAAMTRNQAVMERRVASVQLSAAERSASGRLDRVAHVLLMTEDWCGDAVMNVPIVVRVAEALPAADLRVFVRSAAPELAAHFAGRGITAIPVVTFLDSDYREVATWVERPRTAEALRAEWIAANPDFDMHKKPSELSDEERQLRITKLKELLAAMETWYDGGVQSDTVAEMLALLDRPGEG